MSDFVFIIPQGWQQVSAEVIGNIGSILGDWLTINDYTSLTDSLREYGEIPMDKTVAAAHLFNGEVLAIQLG